MRKLAFLILGIVIGLFIIQYMMDDGERKRQPVAEPASKAPPDKKSASRRWQGTDEKPASQRDDLTTINGIGPSFAKALQQIGITSFMQLAAQDPDDLASRMTARITGERIRRDRWIEQAKALSEKR